ncbi:MAG: M20/M25/M40 family metallo-hydrolase [Acidobacteria bacterium]|nr:M20/M25/M40 family metallo-hydrolase [Acidobacteriota bacterium]
MVAVLLAAVPLLAADEPVDETAIARIKTEAFQRSLVMDTASRLTDVYGARLSGSPALDAAAAWSRDRFREWGLAGATLEPYDHRGRGWSVDGFSAEMVAPQYARLDVHPLAWSPGLATPVRGTPVHVQVASPADFERYRGRLAGAIVLNGRLPEPRSRFEPEASRLSEEALRSRAGAISPTATGAAGSLREEDEEWAASLERRKAIWQFFADERVALVIEPSRFDQGVLGVSGFYDHVWQPTYPGFVMSREHYGRITRLLALDVPVTLEVGLSARYHPREAPWSNVIAEIPGADPAIGREVVMVGAHLDSWHAGTGATDNAAGAAVVMEAARVLAAMGTPPRRTIRFALWTGEEQDYLGSRGYVRAHYSPLDRVAPTAEHALLSAYFNLDNGTGRIRGVHMQGNEAVRPVFEAWLAPFAYLGATTVSTLNTGGTDHMAFDAAGLPAFQFICDPIDYDTETHHTSSDTFEALLEDDLKQASAVVASILWHAAMRDERLPRKP